MSDLLTTDEAAELLGVCAATIRRLEKVGTLRAFRFIGKRPNYYQKAEVEALLRPVSGPTTDQPIDDDPDLTSGSESC